MAKRGRDFVDAWDRALAAAGVTKPGLPTYRLLPDYAERLGAYEWSLDESLHPDVFVGRTAANWIDAHAADERPLFLAGRVPGPASAVRSACDVGRRLSRSRAADPAVSTPRPRRPATAVSCAAREARQRQPRRRAAHHRCAACPASPPARPLPRQRLADRRAGGRDSSQRSSEAGRLANAIVIFTSDHGDCLGDHGHAQKWTMYEQVVRVPMVVWSAGAPRRPRRDRRDGAGDRSRARASSSSPDATCPRGSKCSSLAARASRRCVRRTRRRLLRAGTRRRVPVLRLRLDAAHGTLQVRALPRRGLRTALRPREDPHEEHDRWDDPACRGDPRGAASRVARLARRQRLSHRATGPMRSAEPRHFNDEEVSMFVKRRRFMPLLAAIVAGLPLVASPRRRPLRHRRRRPAGGNADVAARLASEKLAQIARHHGGRREPSRRRRRGGRRIREEREAGRHRRSGSSPRATRPTRR